MKSPTLYSRRLIFFFSQFGFYQSLIVFVLCCEGGVKVYFLPYYLFINKLIEKITFPQQISVAYLFQIYIWNVFLYMISTVIISGNVLNCDSESPSSLFFKKKGKEVLFGFSVFLWLFYISCISI